MVPQLCAPTFQLNKLQPSDVPLPVPPCQSQRTETPTRRPTSPLTHLSSPSRLASVVPLLPAQPQPSTRASGTRRARVPARRRRAPWRGFGGRRRTRRSSLLAWSAAGPGSPSRPRERWRRTTTGRWPRTRGRSRATTAAPSTTISATQTPPRSSSPPPPPPPRPRPPRRLPSTPPPTSGELILLHFWFLVIWFLVLGKQRHQFSPPLIKLNLVHWSVGYCILVQNDLILSGPSVFKFSLLWIFNSFDKDVPDSSDVEPRLLGLQNFQDGAYAEDLANFHERSHADDWYYSSSYCIGSI